MIARRIAKPEENAMPELQIADTEPIDFVRRHLAFTDTPTTARYIALDRGRDEASDSEDRDG